LNELKPKEYLNDQYRPRRSDKSCAVHAKKQESKSVRSAARIFTIHEKLMRGQKMRSHVFKLGVALALLASLCGSRDGVAADVNHDYAELEKAVLEGKDIRMTLDFSACLVHGTEKPGPAVRGSLRFDAFMIRNDPSIAFSTTHFTVRSDKTPVNEFLSFRVEPTGKVDARTMFLNATTYAVFQEAEFDCDIGKGATFHW
jgi:VirK protein